MSLSRFVALTPAQGAETQIYLASSAEGGGASGKYLYKRKQIKPATTALDPEAAERLPAMSERLTDHPYRRLPPVAAGRVG
jgi:hypothetical protein